MHQLCVPAVTSFIAPTQSLLAVVMRLLMREQGQVDDSVFPFCAGVVARDRGAISACEHAVQQLGDATD
ncbi:hypothetical protein M527_11375 [Sphingobium indicum IP26]|uniref:Uncharacterized protein n=1 Tax=Sphingobium indicum F2 TaxID=1450518 RepID=A0A8E1C2B9_9SPHN|nr:hypothetical protein M527_11375 [Sphingobium indicum IP26]EQB00355.1 hypothetical protein L286_17880 [Sphingobium sp. HDIP04]KER36082.1 hypothetical protein AL00_12565 [Sphingobium indicum F2]